MGTINAVSRVREALGETSVKKPPAIAATGAATNGGGDTTGTVVANGGGEGGATAAHGNGEVGAAGESEALGEGVVDLPVTQVRGAGAISVLWFVVCVMCGKGEISHRLGISRMEV